MKARAAAGTQQAGSLSAGTGECITRPVYLKEVAMKADILLKLLEAGYTKQDIDLMEELETPTPQPATPEPATPENGVAETLRTLTETVQSLAQTVQEMQQANIKKAESILPKRFDTAEALKDFFGGQ